MLIVCADELMSAEDERKDKQALRASAASIKVRSWKELIHMLLWYIQLSSELSLGSLDYLLTQMDFLNDATKGMLPRQHILLHLA
jgi:hypothetical protein